MCVFIYSVCEIVISQHSYHTYDVCGWTHESVCTRMVGLGNVVMVIIYMKDVNYSTEVKNALKKRKQAKRGSNIQHPKCQYCFGHDYVALCTPVALELRLSIALGPTILPHSWY